MMRKTGGIDCPEYDLKIEEIERGLLISQRDVSYIARKWQLTEDVVSIIKLAHKAGLTCHWQNGHPKTATHLGNNNFEQGSHHISFAPAHDEKWVFVLGAEAHPPKVDFITFNKAYRHFVANSGVPWRWEWSGGENVFINPKDLAQLLNKLNRKHITAVQNTLGQPSNWKSNITKTGLNSEFLVEQALLEKLKLTPKKPKLNVFVRPRFEGLIPDLIIQGPPHPIILELKLDVAGLPALEQISTYMNLSSINSIHKNLLGGIIARDFHPNLISAVIKQNKIGLYRYCWDGQISTAFVAGRDIFNECGLSTLQ